MTKTIYATFATESDAERAAGALMDHGVRKEEISFILPHRTGAVPTSLEGTPIVPEDGILPGTPATPSAGIVTMPPPSDFPIPDVSALSSTTGERITSLGSNRVGEAPGMASQTGYTYDAEGAGVAPLVAPPLASPPTLNMVPPAPTSQPSVQSQASGVTTMAGNMPIDTVEHDHRHIVDLNRTLPDAARGISTTTGGDAGKGALEGAGVGVGLGLLMGLATVLIPGVGLFAGAGALVAGLAAAAGAAGGVAGGVYGYLHDMGLPPETSQILHRHLESGSPVLSIGIADSVQEGEILMLLRKYNAAFAEAF